MRTIARAGTLALAAVLCLASASSTPYHQSVSHEPLGRGRYFLRVSVNKHTTQGTAVQYFYRRAREICDWEGFAAFEIYDQAEYLNREVTTGEAVAAGLAGAVDGWQNPRGPRNAPVIAGGMAPEVTGVVACVEPRERYDADEDTEAESAPPPRRPATTDDDRLDDAELRAALRRDDERDDEPRPKKRAPGLHVFGGADQSVYLGCFCTAQESDSVLNADGRFGRGSVEADTLWNAFSGYGPSTTSDYSACNPSATNPPALLDADGTYKGRLTTNRDIKDAITSQLVVNWLAQLCKQAAE